MRTLSIDIETYSGNDLGKCGVYKYVEAPDFEILLFAYAFDDGPVRVIDVASGEKLPIEVATALTHKDVLKTAHNANFERTCIAKYFSITLPSNQWECTMVKSAMLGLPFSLDAVAKALRLENKKDSAGKALIRYFSIPCKPTKTNGGRTRNLPEHAPDKWEAFTRYCIQDVEVEREIKNKISFFVIPDAEKKLWQLDQEINDNGVMLDMDVVEGAIKIDEEYKEMLTEEATRLTGLDNPNSPAQLKDYLTEALGVEVTSLTKTAIPELMELAESDKTKRVLGLRQEMAKTSVKKYQAMQNAVCADGRVRGLLQFYGANRTGRWAGRLVQVQNLPKNHLPDLDLARQVVKTKDTELLEMLYASVPDTLSQLIRTAFVAADGGRFIVADFSAIEARVLAWLAEEKWVLDVFRGDGKIYEATASKMFNVPMEEITKGSELRQKGKVSTLALGYQGGPGALVTMGALKAGIPEEELPGLVAAWRRSNPKIVKFWKTCENAAIEAVETGCKVAIGKGISFQVSKGVLFVTLPSGRKLSYLRPKLQPGRFGGMQLTYEGMEQTSRQWKRHDTYGGKLVENITQAVARDCLAVAMLRLQYADYKIVMHVHDEVIIEASEDEGSLDGVLGIMGAPIEWATGLPLTADGYETKYYKKD